MKLIDIVIQDIRDVLLAAQADSIQSEFSCPLDGEDSDTRIHHYHALIDGKEYLVSIVPTDLHDAAPKDG